MKPKPTTSRECLLCGHEIILESEDYKAEKVQCPDCGQPHAIDVDAEFDEGQWRNLTTLRLLP